ncbi:MAG TPA: hybrid sensor histidine kinase/response regulator [Planctomycetaceae bacterium]|nr:hybrid sensor histidine kinase/response regulator [Planctomycetaceae bacterium]
MKRDLLYVDDEPDNIVVFEAAFEEDFKVWSAASGQQALEMLEQTAIPVVVSDQRMPAMTGVELFSIMRRKYPHIQRIILTGYTDPEGMIDAINQGQVFHFVKKPWERPFLFSVLVRAFQAHDLSVANSALTDQLVLSERLAMLGQATARLAHEMGNHLCLLPLIEYIEDHCQGDEEMLKLARLSRDSIQRLTGMVHEVKSFTQFQQQEFAKQLLPLSEVVHELVSFLRFDKSVPFQQILIGTRSDPVVLGHKVKLQQVLLNLVKNAAHAIRGKADGKIVLTVTSDQHEAVLQVADNGTGMAPHVKARIWEPFFTTKGKEGTGLGLDICRKLIVAHGGTITFETTAGAGTTFEIRIPMALGA